MALTVRLRKDTIYRSSRTFSSQHMGLTCDLSTADRAAGNDLTTTTYNCTQAAVFSRTALEELNSYLRFCGFRCCGLQIISYSLRHYDHFSRLKDIAKYHEILFPVLFLFVTEFAKRFINSYFLRSGERYLGGGEDKNGGETAHRPKYVVRSSCRNSLTA